MKIYKVYCLKESGIIKYIGQTRQKLSKRANSHRCYSWFKDKQFAIELIDEFYTPEPMYKLEASLIRQHDLVNVGWNRSYGYDECPEQADMAGMKNGFYGHTHRPELCEKIGKRSIGNSYAKGSKSRRGLKNSEYHQQKLIEARKRKVKCIDTGEIFESLKDCAIKLNVSETHIGCVCRGRRKTTGGLKFAYVD
jgi:hypothetical protein